MRCMNRCLLQLAVVAITLVAFASAPPATAATPLDQLKDTHTAPYRVLGRGMVTDASHPVHPGDFREYALTLTLSIDPELGEAVLEFETGEGSDKSTDRYFVRRGRVFQVDEQGKEVAPEPFGDVSPATVATLYPALVIEAMRERRDSVRLEGAPAAKNSSYLFAANDELWSARVETKGTQLVSLTRRVFSDVFGDGEEQVRYQPDPARVTVNLRGRETCRIDFSAPQPTSPTTPMPAVPAGDAKRDRNLVIAARDVSFQELAPHLYSIDLPALNSRVFVAEFADYLVVLEGAYTSRNADRLAQKIRERFAKPVRYFAFSHLHGQYVGGTRSWIAEGATVLVPPSTAPLIEAVAAARFDLRPDVLSQTPKPLKLEAVKDTRRLEDSVNTLEVYNVESEHTDEYFIFYFPQQKVLLTGDLLFYRPGKPLTGRSKKVCETVAKLGLEPEQFVATWPLDGLGTKNIISGDEMSAACQPKP